MNRTILSLLAEMTSNYVNKDNLLYFKTKLETIFAKKTDLENKVDKVEGKQLSTNDYTNEEKQKLSGLENYVLPQANSSTLGGVKVGAGLTIDGDGILSATGGGVADSVAWENVTGRPTKVSEFTNDADYQSSSQVSSIVDEKLATITQIEFKFMDSLAELPPTGKTGVIYFVKKNDGEIALLAETEDLYDQYVWNENNQKYEVVGNEVKVDLTGYYNEENFIPITNEDIDNMFN